MDSSLINIPELQKMFGSVSMDGENVRQLKSDLMMMFMFVFVEVETRGRVESDCISMLSRIIANNNYLSIQKLSRRMDKNTPYRHKQMNMPIINACNIIRKRIIRIIEYFANKLERSLIKTPTVECFNLFVKYFYINMPAIIIKIWIQYKDSDSIAPVEKIPISDLDKIVVDDVMFEKLCQQVLNG